MRGEHAPSKASINSQYDYVRLHITPLDSELVNTIIPAAVLPSARNISFHTLDTLPEKRYGFVDLPLMDADKLKKKLNGSLLKGSKIRIENARAERQIEPTGFTEELESERNRIKNVPKTAKSYKINLNFSEGFTLEDRRVKRGWTEPFDTVRKKSKNEEHGKCKKRKRQKSKYTDQEECLLRIKVPPNVAVKLSQDCTSNSKKGRKMRAATIHEFEKTTRFPGFLKHTAPQVATITTEFIEGKGWVDKNGNVVEAMTSKVPATPARHQEMTRSQRKIKPEDEHDDSTSSSDTSSEEENEKDNQAEEHAKRKHKKQSTYQVDHKSNATEDSQASVTRHVSPVPVAGIDDLKQTSSTGLTVKSRTPATPTTSAVHPLEALYKKQKPNSDDGDLQRQAESFNFFGEESEGEGREDEKEDQEEEGHEAEKAADVTAPMTPFTQRDFEWRKVRSAAPTPDTTHASRKHTCGDTSARDGDDNSRMEIALRTAESATLEAAPSQDQTDFQTWFWANRSELIRSWKSRRKTALKEKRYSDNKVRASRAL